MARSHSGAVTLINEATRMRFGIKQKILLVLIGLLAFTIGLIALLASSYTNRQGEEAAFAALGNDLIAWQADLQSAAAQIRQGALAVVGEAWVSRQLAELLMIELRSGER